ncbi:unnamed protein product [Allacma fusca]|uniref:Uncharacterized protein n=1 Tax=Allacma fusca TaxID=39272 RepID=A0A8J2KH50_9HEXA|nr:unnamed protein product [Allacma fusca]
MCVPCSKSLEIFDDTGIWTNTDAATLYEFAQKINGTLELAPAFNHDDPNNFEENDFIKPLTDGTGTASTILLFSPSLARLIYRTVPIKQQHVCFFSALPKRTKFNSLLRLAHPFEYIVWILVALCIFAVFAILETFRHMAYHFDNTEDYSETVQVLPRTLMPFATETLGHEHYKSLFVLLRPILDQGSNAGAIFNENKRCYEKIQDGHSVCTGYSAIFDAIGLQYFIDVKGRNMFLRSKDCILPMTGFSGISRYYPHFIEIFNFIARSLESGGFIDLWYKHMVKMKSASGRIRAQSMVDTLKFYSGEEEEEASTQQIVSLSVQLLFMGHFGGTICFTAEYFFYNCLYRKKLNLLVWNR